MKKREQIDYFKLLRTQAELSCKAAAKLMKILLNYDAIDILDSVSNLHAVEKEADNVKETIVKALVKEFLPPIEREDIMLLSEELDSVTDNIEDVLRGLYMYNVSILKPEVVPFCSLVCKICDKLLEAVTEFREFKKSSKLSGLLLEVNNLETQGDEIYTNATRTLFTTSVDPRELLIWQNLFNKIELICDTCEHAADAIEVAAMKNS